MLKYIHSFLHPLPFTEGWKADDRNDKASLPSYWHFCTMELLETTFRIGVILAIFGFLWGIVQLVLMLFTGSSQQQRTLLLSVKYFFLGQVLALFCYDQSTELSLQGTSVVISALLLAFYFIQKAQNRQKKNVLFSMVRNGMPVQQATTPNKAIEIGLIVWGMVCFTVFVLFPEYAENGITDWFKSSIIDLEDAPIFGFIFKIIGFFFLLNLIFKTIQSIQVLVSGKRPIEDPINQRDDDDFDDYEEIK